MWTWKISLITLREFREPTSYAKRYIVEGVWRLLIDKNIMKHNYNLHTIWNLKQDVEIIEEFSLQNRIKGFIDIMHAREVFG